MNYHILLAFESPTEETKLLTWELRNELRKDAGFTYAVSIASGHKTPERVREHAQKEPWDAVIASASLTNALVHEYMKYVPVNTMVIGLPVKEKKSQGLAAVLSSQEFPEGTVAPCVGLDQLKSAIYVARDLVMKEYARICVWDVSEEPDVAVIAKLLDFFEITYTVRVGTSDMIGDKIKDIDRTLSNLDEQAVRESISKEGGKTMVTGTSAFEPLASDELLLCIVDTPEDMQKILCSTSQACIATCKKGNIEESMMFDGEWYFGYQTEMAACENTAFVGFDNQMNLGLFGAKVLARRSPQIKTKVEKVLAQQKRKYEQFKDVRKIN